MPVPSRRRADADSDDPWGFGVPDGTLVELRHEPPPEPTDELPPAPPAEGANGIAPPTSGTPPSPVEPEPEPEPEPQPEPEPVAAAPPSAPAVVPPTAVPPPVAPPTVVAPTVAPPTVVPPAVVTPPPQPPSVVAPAAQAVSPPAPAPRAEVAPSPLDDSSDLRRDRRGDVRAPLGVDHAGDVRPYPQPPAVPPQRVAPGASRRFATAALALGLIVLSGAGAYLWFTAGADRSAEAARPVGTFVLSSHPPGAQVVVDGVPAGPTPLALQLTPGPHAVVVTGAGGISEQLSATVAAGESVSRHLVLEPPAPPRR